MPQYQIKKEEEREEEDKATKPKNRIIFKLSI